MSENEIMNMQCGPIPDEPQPKEAAQVEDEKLAPEELEAIAKTSLILYVRELKKVNENALNKIVELQQQIATLQQRIAELEQEVKRVNIGREKARAKRNEYEKMLAEKDKQIINQRLQIKELASLQKERRKDIEDAIGEGMDIGFMEGTNMIDRVEANNKRLAYLSQFDQTKKETK